MEVLNGACRFKAGGKVEHCRLSELSRDELHPD
jgi:hypothetical protein